MSDQAASPTNENALPMFYKNAVPLRAETFKDVKIRPENDYSFAANVNAIPVSGPEFVMASRHYPIIFVGENPVPLAVVGLNPDANLFVDSDGKWEVGQYIPAYVRRYPFLLLNDGGPDGNAGLGFDDQGGTSTHPDARPLFPEGASTDTANPPEVIKEAINLCEQFHGAFLQTEKLMAALKDAGILEDRTLGVRDDNGENRDIGQFKAIKEEKFRELPDATIGEWRKSGFLSAAYFHLASLNNWDNIFFRGQLRQNGQKIGVLESK